MNSFPLKKHYSMQDRAMSVNAEIMQALIDASGLTKTEISQKLKLKSKSAVSAWQKHKALCRRVNILKMANIFGIKDASILVETDPSVETLKALQDARNKASISGHNRSSKKLEELQNANGNFDKQLDGIENQIINLTQAINKQNHSISDLYAENTSLRHLLTDYIKKSNDTSDKHQNYITGQLKQIGNFLNDIATYLKLKKHFNG